MEDDLKKNNKMEDDLKKTKFCSEQLKWRPQKKGKMTLKKIKNGRWPKKRRRKKKDDELKKNGGRTNQPKSTQLAVTPL
jgi:hypothetical protein